jgi:hypothetical protein
MYKKMIYGIFLFLLFNNLSYAESSHKFPVTKIEEQPQETYLKIVLSQNNHPIEKIEKNIPLEKNIVLDNLRKRIIIEGTAEVCTYQYPDVPEATTISDTNTKKEKIPYEHCHMKLIMKKIPHGMIFTIVKVEEKKIDFIFEKLNLINLQEKYPTNTEKFIYIGQILEKNHQYQKTIILPDNEKVDIQIGQNIEDEDNID